MVEDIFDFHSHILPGVDDGFKDVSQSVEALKMSYRQGVRHLALTPHYYADESVEHFLYRRQRAMAKLEKAMAADGGPFPELCLGVEVAYHPYIRRSEQLSKLCLGKSRYMLLELPFRRWDADVLTDVQAMCNMGEVIPVLVHIERYLPLQNKRIAEEMLNLDLCVQMNGEFILPWRTGRIAVDLLRDSPAYLLGSDAHNLTDRAPNLGPAIAKLKKKKIDSALLRMQEMSRKIWEEALDGYAEEEVSKSEK